MRANLLLYADGDLFNPRPEFARHAPRARRRPLRPRRAPGAAAPAGDPRRRLLDPHLHGPARGADPEQRARLDAAAPRRLRHRRCRREALRADRRRGLGRERPRDVPRPRRHLGALRPDAARHARGLRPRPGARARLLQPAPPQPAGRRAQRRPRRARPPRSRRSPRAATRSSSAPRTSTTCTSAPATAPSTTCTASSCASAASPAATPRAWRDDLATATPCPACGRAGGLRPDVVWFGEMPHGMDAIEAALADGRPLRRHRHLRRGLPRRGLRRDGARRSASAPSSSTSSPPTPPTSSTSAATAPPPRPSPPSSTTCWRG